MSEAARLRAMAAAGTAERWSLPAVEGPIMGGRRDWAAGSDPADRALQAERTRGYEAGMAAGRAEIQRLTAELKARVQRLDSALALLAKPLAELDGGVQQQLALLALAIGKQLARREIKASPGEIIALIRESIARLPVSARDVRIHLHPEDAALVREHLAAPAAERAWTLVEDATQTRGGCVVRTETSQIDLRFESRVNAIVSSLLVDERSGQRDGGRPDASDGERRGEPEGGATSARRIDAPSEAASARPIEGRGEAASEQRPDSTGTAGGGADPRASERA